MRFLNNIKISALPAFALLALLLAGCSISDVKDKDSGAEKVAINTPMGALKVQTGINPQEVGLKVYPGATLKPHEDSDNGNKTSDANVNINTPFFGLRVIALDYLSNDAPAKVLDFYRNDMKQYGKVIECEGTNVQAEHKDGQSGMKLELNCNDTGKGDGTELKAGEGSSQHIVSVKPNDKGAEFTLLYIAVHDESKNTI